MRRRSILKTQRRSPRVTSTTFIPPRPMCFPIGRGYIFVTGSGKVPGGPQRAAPGFSKKKEHPLGGKFVFSLCTARYFLKPVAGIIPILPIAGFLFNEPGPTKSFRARLTVQRESCKSEAMVLTAGQQSSYKNNYHRERTRLTVFRIYIILHSSVKRNIIKSQNITEGGGR